MTTTLKKIDPTQVQLDIEVDAPELARAREQALRKLSQQLRLPGFRPGHIPHRIVEQHVGTEHVEHEAIETVVPDAYAKALEEHDLDPVDRPKIDLAPSDDGKTLKFTATVAVRPEITLGAYTGVTVNKPAVHVSDADVDESLESLRRRAATLEPVEDRGIEDGDVVTLDYAGRIDGELFEGGSATNHTTEISPERFIPGFAEQLRGARAAEQRTLNVSFPAAYKPELLAGKAAVFDVTVHDIKTPVLPALDQDFVKQVSDLPDLAALRDAIRSRLERMQQARAAEAVENELIEKITAAHEFPLPDVLVTREAEAMLHEAKHDVERAGADWKTYLQSQNMLEDELMERLKGQARRRIKTGLLIEQIGKKENISVSGSDVDHEIDALARSSGQSRRATLEALQKNDALGRLLSAIKRNKTIAFLVEKAEVVETPPPHVATVKEQ